MVPSPRAPRSSSSNCCWMRRDGRSDLHPTVVPELQDRRSCGVREVAEPDSRASYPDMARVGQIPHIIMAHLNQFVEVRDRHVLSVFQLSPSPQDVQDHGCRGQSSADLKQHLLLVSDLLGDDQSLLVDLAFLGVHTPRFKERLQQGVDVPTPSDMLVRGEELVPQNLRPGGQGLELLTIWNSSVTGIVLGRSPRTGQVCWWTRWLPWVAFPGKLKREPQGIHPGGMILRELGVQQSGACEKAVCKPLLLLSILDKFSSLGGYQNSSMPGHASAGSVIPNSTRWCVLFCEPIV
jgi:hypothetical protein